MNDFKNGDAIVEVTKNTQTDIIENFKTAHKPKELTGEEKSSSIKTEITKDETKEFVKNSNIVRYNMKYIYSLLYGNCTEGVQTMLKADADYK